ncbi:radical SAM protein [Myxococcaceae bacterium GXIMD 01537]
MTSHSEPVPGQEGAGSASPRWEFPVADYERVVRRFEAFAANAAHSELWQRVLRRAVDPIAGIPACETVVSDGLVWLDDPRALAAVLGGSATRAILRDDVLWFGSAVDELAAHASGAGEAERVLLDVLLRRALRPAEALGTYPLSAFFEPEEVATLRALRHQEPAPPGPPATWEPGQDADYKAYYCVILKVTRHCNLRCTYCVDWREGPGQRMKFDVMATVLSKIIGSRRANTVDFVWHGGEPTLLGRRGFLRVLAMERWFRRAGQQVRNTIQSNAVLIDDTWARFLAHYGLQISVSLDGVPQTHDAVRLKVNGRGSSEDVRRGIRALRSAGAFGGVLVVASRAVMEAGAEALVRFLLEEGISDVSILALVPGAGDSAEAGDRTAYARFLLDMERARLARPESPLAVRELDAALRTLDGKSPGHCELMGNCVGAFFSVEPDGRIAHCDKFAGDPAFNLGDLRTEAFDDILANEATRRVRAGAESRREVTRDCRYFRQCRGWCPHETYLSRHRTEPAACCGLSELFDGLTRARSDGPQPDSPPVTP